MPCAGGHLGARQPGVGVSAALLIGVLLASHLGAAIRGAYGDELRLSGVAVPVWRGQGRRGLSSGLAMNGPDATPSSDPRLAAWIGATSVLFVASIVVGFAWLQIARGNGAALESWATICRAVGLPRANFPPGSIVAGPTATTIAWTSATRAQLKRGDATQGATLAAASCNNCHGANGISSDAAFPNLAGQSVGAIDTQFEDFKSGKRDAVALGVFVDPPSEQDLRDLATHFASVADPGFCLSPALTADASGASCLIDVGNPMRGITACAACHRPLGLVPGAPTLQGQQRAYRPRAQVHGHARNLSVGAANLTNSAIRRATR